MVSNTFVRSAGLLSALFSLKVQAGASGTGSTTRYWDCCKVGIAPILSSISTLTRPSSHPALGQAKQMSPPQSESAISQTTPSQTPRPHPAVPAAQHTCAPTNLPGP
jgi:hypothetical protein